MQKPDWNRLKFPLLTGLIAVVILSFFLGEITKDLLENASVVRLDQCVLDRAASIHNRFLTPAMIFATNLGGGIPIWPIIFLSVIFLYRWGRRFEAGFICAVMAGGMILDQFLKFSIQRARPVPPSGAALTHAWGWSYPSGHVVLAVLFYFTVAYLIWRHSGSRVVGATAFGVAFLISVLIAFSRVYLQVHYLSDVIAGLIGGLLWFALCSVLAGWYRRR